VQTPPRIARSGISSAADVFLVCAGDTFWIEGMHRIEVPKHLYIVVSDPSQDNENILIANVTSDGSWDDSCVLVPGDHPSIKHESYVNFQRAKCVTRDGIRSGHDSGIFSFDVALSPEVLDKVRKGAGNSRFLAKKFRKLHEEQGLLDQP
jgi:hypothetical protein